ncbi:hypothetical protein L1987_35067 [Smallanthus sonchifolius]|uniref:Uncharacterized protein n=1 Tax=Smallanthus sonchifolius TaxID=185202 RepID=A0ACB9HWZ5_9ASTR|nr:hypothetical protein L1987_35067 [Smallanthus sonchifolius]
MAHRDGWFIRESLDEVDVLPLYGDDNFNVWQNNVEGDDNVNVRHGGNDHSEGDDNVNVEGDNSIGEDEVHGGNDHSEKNVHASDEDNGGSDYIVDEDNTMVDHEVDMTDYRMNVDSDVEDNTVADHEDVDLEDEVLDNEKFQSGSESDGNDTSIRRHGLHNLRRDIENRANFYLSQEFGSKEEGKSQPKGAVVDKGKGKGAVVDKGKCKGAVVDKGKGKGAVVDKGEEQVAENPEIPVTAVQDQFARKFEVGVSRMQAYRARAKAKKVVEGDYTKQYAMLRDYGLELKDKNPGRALSNVLLNNMCEVYNGKIVQGRDRPIIYALEYIREYLMRQIVTVLKVIDKSEGLLTPNATKMLEAIKKDAAHYHVQWNGEDRYSVTRRPSEPRVMDLGKRTCACRRWEIIGMPCRHAVAAIWFKATNG